LRDVLYADFSTWKTLSGGSRRVADGAANIDHIPVVKGGQKVNDGIRTTAAAISKGGPMAELICVADNPDGRGLVLVEGHNRATAYVLAAEPPDEGEIIVGWSPDIAHWPYF
jgi:hypothetical protein